MPISEAHFVLCSQPELRLFQANYQQSAGRVPEPDQCGLMHYRGSEPALVAADAAQQDAASTEQPKRVFDACCRGATPHGGGEEGPDARYSMLAAEAPHLMEVVRRVKTPDI